MFSNQEFIEASRDFVCVRLETYESAEHEKLIRSLLGGRYANTAFCVLAPDGETRLTQTSRSPSTILGATGRGPNAQEGSVNEVIAAMEEIVDEYSRRDPSGAPILQDFHTFRQALNVASGDQRLLFFVSAEERYQEKVQDLLGPVFADKDVIGRFHVDYQGDKDDAHWVKAVTGSSSKPGYYIIRADTFGQEGEVVAAMPLNTNLSTIRSTLLAANRDFAADEERKIYSDHVQEGRKQGISFETEIPFGEDRDGDGKIDSGGKGKGKGKGK